MAIDFTLTPEQCALQSEARQFAREVLAGVRAATDKLPTAEERFLATRPAYEAMVAAGYCANAFRRPQAVTEMASSTWPSWPRNSTA